MPVTRTNDRAFGLDLDGRAAGLLTQFTGLDVEAEVVVQPGGTNGTPQKQVASITPTPGRATVGIGMGKGMYEWIRLAFDNTNISKSGAVLMTDMTYKVRSQIAFKNALITEVRFPSCDASSKEAGLFSVVFQPESIDWGKGNGKDIRDQAGTKTKAWTVSNFSVTVGNLPCKRVAKIDGFTLKQNVDGVTIPDLRLTIAEADYQLWADAAKEWLLDGGHRTGKLMGGAITLLGADEKREVGRLSLHGVGIKSFSHISVLAHSAARYFQVTLYVEQMKFHLAEHDV